MSDPMCQPLRLKEWLMLQIESGRFPGLCWDNPEKTCFRIPWKHAAKQDYRMKEDAALFRAWAMYKGKFRDGASKMDPTVWKTRLRCALNKSPDFQEVQENSQLDLTQPFKVYRIVSESQGSAEGRSRETAQSLPKQETQRTSETDDHESILQKKEPMETNEQAPETHPEPHHVQTVNQRKSLLEVAPSSPQHMKSESQSDAAGKQYEVTGKFLFTAHALAGKVTDAWERGFINPLTSSSSDFWLHLRLYYQNKLVTEVTTQTAEGCRLAPAGLSPCESLSLQEVSLPFPHDLPVVLSLDTCLVLQRLLVHLDRGVLLWVAPEGVFAKRQCQGRVYWSGPLAPHRDQPNKLEKDKTCKVLDTDTFMHELNQYVTCGGPEPQYNIQLCFGEEYPSTTNVTLKKLLTVHVEPVFARELFLNAQQSLRAAPSYSSSSA